MRKIFQIAAATAALALAACTPKTAVSGADPSIRFNADGKLKIMQLTDTHLCNDNPGEFAKTFAQFRNILDIEKPDVIIHTGDMVFGGGNVGPSIEEFYSAADERKIPFISLYGNHDRERDLSEWDQAKAVTSHPMSLNTVKDGYLDDVALRVLSPDGKKVEAVLYCIDSNDYSQVPEYGGYAWIAHSQIAWYEHKSKAFAKANGNMPVPSYAFFHIPLCEFGNAYEEHPLIGVRQENECPGTRNSGLLTAFIENQDVHGVFCGHDHNNDYIADEHGVALVYGRYSGDNTVYNDLERGIRIIQLSEGDFGFRTWIRERDGKVVDDYTYAHNADYPLHKAVKAKGREHGLTLTLYNGVDGLGNMETEAIKAWSDVADCLRLYTSPGKPRSGFIFEGYLDVPETGLWNFLLALDDDGILSIDGVPFMESSGWVRDRIHLEKGFHHIKIALKSSPDSYYVKLMWYLQGEDRYHEITPDHYYLK